MKKNKLERNLKKAVATKSGREALRYVHYDKDGSITATNSHVLLRIDKFHTYSHSFNLNPFDMTLGMGDYPDAKRVIPEEKKSPIHVSMSYSAIKGMIDYLKHYPKGEYLNISITDYEFKTSIQFPFETLLDPATDAFSFASIELSKDFVQPNYDAHYLTIKFNPKYFLGCLEFFYDYLESKDPKEPDIEFYFEGDSRPILAEAKDARYVVTPLRTF